MNHSEMIGVSDEELLAKGDRDFYYCVCPYCNQQSWRLLSKGDSVESNGHVSCPNCTETNPYDKIKNALDKARTLEDIADKTTDETKRRVLLEQCIVVIATAIEIFLRDAYSTIMNLRYVKINQTLIQKFLKDSRNEFTNIDRARDRFKTDLGIDLASVMPKDKIGELILLMAKRNAIVHNNGIADDQFLRQIERSGNTQGMIRTLRQEYKRMETIPISVDEVCIYLSTSHIYSRKLGEVFDDEYRKINMDYLFEYLRDMYLNKMF